MNEMIELHDSQLVAFSWADGVAIILLRPVHVHRSEGRPGVDAGTVWLQEAMFTVTNAAVSALGKLPARVLDGSMRVGIEMRKNLIPSAGVFVADIELKLSLQGADHLTVRCDQLMVTLTGQAEFAENFEPAKLPA